MVGAANPPIQGGVWVSLLKQPLPLSGRPAPQECPSLPWSNEHSPGLPQRLSLWFWTERTQDFKRARRAARNRIYRLPGEGPEGSAEMGDPDSFRVLPSSTWVRPRGLGMQRELGRWLKLEPLTAPTGLMSPHLQGPGCSSTGLPVTWTTPNQAHGATGRELALEAGRTLLWA